MFVIIAYRLGLQGNEGAPANTLQAYLLTYKLYTEAFITYVNLAQHNSSQHEHNGSS